MNAPLQPGQKANTQMASKRTGYLFSNILLNAKQRRIIWSGEHVKNLYQIHDRFENILQVNGNIRGFTPLEIWKSGKTKPLEFDPTDLYEYVLSCPNAMHWDEAAFPLWVGPGDWVYYDRFARFSSHPWFVRWTSTNGSGVPALH